MPVTITYETCEQCHYAWYYTPEGKYKCSCREEGMDLSGFPVIPDECPLL